MSYDPKVLRTANARLEARRAAHQAEQARLRREVYARLPRVAEIDAQLRQSTIQVISAALKQGTDPAPVIRVLRDRSLELQAERAELLTAAGYPLDALDERPLCPKCGDTGWQGARMCQCLKQLCTQAQIEQLSSLLPLGEQSFDTFDLDFYSPRPWPQQELSPRENMEMVRDICYRYASRFSCGELKNLLLSGAPGLGKTFLSACIAREVSQQGFSVVYDTAGSIFAQFEAQKFERDPAARDGTRRYLGCDLLILDDLGSEMTTPFVQSALYTLINSRLVADRRTVISTNLSVAELGRRYTPQIASRLEGEFRILPFYGEDIRLQKKNRA